MTINDQSRCEIAGTVSWPASRTAYHPDRVKTPCRNGNEHLSNPTIACCDTTLRADSRHGVNLARHGRAFEFSHGLDTKRSYTAAVTRQD